MGNGENLKKHILVISQYFYPEQFRINDICKEWIKKGYKVTVVTGIPNYPEGKYYNGYGLCKKRKEKYEGVSVIRLPLIPRGNNKIMLTLNYFSFVGSGLLWKVFSRVKADYVFVFGVSPMTQALPGVWYAKKRGIPCYLYVQDLWPENVEVITGISNKFIIGSIGKMVDYIYKHCEKIFTSSTSFINAINERGVQKGKIEFWPQYAEAFYIPKEKKSMQEIPDDEKMNIVFTGNIGAAQGLEILPKAAKIMKEQNRVNIRFNLIGDGRFKKELIILVKKYQVEEMFNFIDQQPAERIPDFIAACDATFLSLVDSPIFTMTIPAKLQSYMACGKPIIAAVNGESRKIIREANAGYSCEAGDVVGLCDILYEFEKSTYDEREKYGECARTYSMENFNKVKLLNHMDVYFDAP